MSSDMASGLVARHISCELGGRKVLEYPMTVREAKK